MAQDMTTVAAPATAAPLDLDTQRLRILRCTAKALAGSLGGFRFKAGTRPWLDELSRMGAATVAAAGVRPMPRTASD